MAEPLGISVPVTPSGGIDSRLYQGQQITPTAQRHDEPRGGASGAAPSTELHFGTIVEAIVRAPAVPASAAGTLAVGTHLLLRIVAMPTAPSAEVLIGRIISNGGAETLMDTPLGLLAVQRRWTFAPDTMIAFERLEEIAPELAAVDPPSRSGGWPALEDALASLTQSSPQLAARLRAELTPLSGSSLAATLLFLLGALYHGNWPGPAANAALAAAGQAKLVQRLSDDVEALHRLEADPATGDWRVLTLPLLAGKMILPLRLFLRRRKADTAIDERTRFAIEVELSGLGPLQLDGMLRGTHLILLLRSHRGLSEELRQNVMAVCRRALVASGLTGELSFVVSPEFPLAPLSNLRKHVEVSA